MFWIMKIQSQSRRRYDSISDKLSGIEWNAMDEMNVEDSCDFFRNKCVIALKSMFH